MTSSIQPRRVRFGWSEDTPRYWYGGDPFMTHFMNALSTTFPEGEAWFVRSVQHYRDRIEDPELLAAIRAFAAQEGAHGREHHAHLEALVAQGYPGLRKLHEMAARETRFLNRHLPLFSLAGTVALEHLTAILARQILENPGRWVAPMHEDMAPVWRWHAIEEAEHKAVAFDVLKEVDGRYFVRVLALLLSTLSLALDNAIRLTYLLHRDGLLWKPSVWWRGLRHMFRPCPELRQVVRDYCAWFRPSFHPHQRDDQALIDAEAAALRQAGYVLSA